MKYSLILVAALAATAGPAAAQSASPRRPHTASERQGQPGNAKAKPGASNKLVVSSGGQGHNSGPDPKGKTVVAPSSSPAGPKKNAAASQAKPASY